MVGNFFVLGYLFVPCNLHYPLPGAGLGSFFGEEKAEFECAVVTSFLSRDGKGFEIDYRVM